ncbi:hypothetical protein Adu01nite_55950 [Paractinoplanes durhamensis]|uniref:Uncharacterized protein n=1 Tax=Paractinoplanes durhamensis TaxID=113563 RepID=A0ABQ3Z346_9ACTN|nr:hypothetical protein Adu01nite_55950 [Actinoplanes durhamensis]
MVLSRLESGDWVRWRVGRRRLAWLPGAHVLGALQFAQDPFTLFVAIPVLAWWLGTWLAALLATLVVWPVRMVTGRWTVVAYMLNSPGDERFRRLRVDGREAADATVQQWASDIRAAQLPASQAFGVRQKPGEHRS